MSRTEEFVTWLCVMAVQTPYPAPITKTRAAIGRNTRNGLKIVMTRSMMSRNFGPSLLSLIFEVPMRGRASTG